MHTRFKLIAGVALAALATVPGLAPASLVACARAAELLDPVPLLTSGLAANPSPASGCTPTGEGHVDEFRAVGKIPG